MKQGKKIAAETAGNQIIIKRNTSGGYKPMELTYDPKIRSGSVVPPDLPSNPGTGTGDWYVASWKQLP